MTAPLSVPLAEALERMTPAARAEFEATVLRLALIIAPPVAKPRRRRPNVDAVIPAGTSEADIERVRRALTGGRR